MKINLKELVQLYDNQYESDSPHVSAITGMMGEEFAVALFCHYLANKEDKVILEVLPKCNGGTRRGKRLDRWVLAKLGENIVAYQTEIKNWSSHSMGGVMYPNINRDDNNYEDILKTYRTGRWEKEFDKKKKNFKTDLCGKVLIRMQLPENNEVKASNVKPLIIFWDSMHPDGCDEEFFEVDVDSECFEKLSVFSMSTYVRKLMEKEIYSIESDMKILKERMDRITRIVDLSP